MTRTLFLQFTVGEWTDEELDEVLELLHEFLPDDVKPMAVPKDLDFLSEEEVDQLIEELQ